ncbi:MAG TPA: ECF-type sigma factor [Bryobacteraceae bacterium]|jgi:RNA polymerase sigma factor (TIGR02999 family)|nr:ECF-type sigma factor [Bryobacteraceae bacterium]
MEVPFAAGAASRALDDLIPDLYAELRRLARSYLRSERQNHTLQPTALVHEAYLKLLEQHKIDWQNRPQVLGVAAHLMRRVLASHAERRNAQKRPGKLQQLTLDVAHCLRGQMVDFVEIDQLLSELAELDSRQGRVVELRLFGGLTSAQIAEVLSVSVATVERDWASARLWLARELSRGQSQAGEGKR